MNEQQAKFEGLKSFELGKGRAPALNNAFIVAACASKTDTALLLKAYLFGWDIANLANNALPGSPSIQTYANIVTGLENAS